MKRSTVALASFALAVGCGAVAPADGDPADGAPPDHGSADHAAPSLDASDDGEAAADVEAGPACADPLVVVAADDDTVWFGTTTGHSPVALTTVAGGARRRVTVLPYKYGFVAAWTDPSHLVQSAFWWAGSWEAPAPIPNAGSLDAPALTTSASAVTAFHLTLNAGFVGAIEFGTAWKPLPLSPGSGAVRAPTAAVFNNDVASALVTGTGAIRCGTIYGGSVTIPIIADKDQQAMLVSPASGPPLLMVFHAPGDAHLSWTTASNVLTWSAPTVIHPDVATLDDVNVLALLSGKVELTYRGLDGVGYVTEYDAWKVPRWTAPLPIGAPTLVESAPSGAIGNCGDDVVFAVARAGSGVRLVRRRKGVFAPPELVSGTLGARIVGIAARSL